MASFENGSIKSNNTVRSISKKCFFFPYRKTGNSEFLYQNKYMVILISL